MLLETLFELAFCLSDYSGHRFCWNTFLECLGAFALHRALLWNVSVNWWILKTILKCVSKFSSLIAFTHSLESWKYTTNFVKTGHRMIISESCHKLISLPILFSVIWWRYLKSNHTDLFFRILTFNFRDSWMRYWTVGMIVSGNSWSWSWNWRVLYSGSASLVFLSLHIFWPWITPQYGCYSFQIIKCFFTIYSKRCNIGLHKYLRERHLYVVNFINTFFNSIDYKVHVIQVVWEHFQNLLTLYRCQRIFIYHFFYELFTFFINFK